MTLTYDELLTEHVGEFGTYQILIFLLVGLGAIPSCCLNVGIVFLAAVPDHWCKTQSLKNMGLSQEEQKTLTIPYDEDDEEYDQCDKFDRSFTNWTAEDIAYALNSSAQNFSTVDCDDGWTYSEEYYKSSIVTEWDLVCDRRWLQATAASVFMAGLMVGVVVTGSLSDALGRKPVLCASCVGLTVVSTVECFAVSYVMFVVVRFLIGVFAISVFTVAFVICVEIVGPSWRSFVGIMIELFWVAGYVLIPFFAYFIREWPKLHAAFAATSVPCLLYFWLLKESPRWLYVRQRTDEAEELVRHIAKVNKRTLPEKLVVEAQKNKTGFIWDLFRTRRMRIRAINTIYLWFVSSLVYYGLSLSSSNLSSNPYLDVFLSGIVELPAYLCCVPALTYIGRRITLSGTMLVAGAALLLTLAIPDDQDTATIALVLIGKFSISAAFAVVYVVTAEVFPTTVRNVAVSCGSFGGRVGGILAPYIGQLSDYGEAIPIIIFGACAAAAGVTSMFLPETKGVTLPETMEDGENFGIKENQNTSPKTEVNGQINPVFTDLAETDKGQAGNVTNTGLTETDAYQPSYASNTNL